MVSAYFPAVTQFAINKPVDLEQKWQTVQSSIVYPHWAEIQPLQNLFIFRKIREVQVFLEEYSFLIPVLADAYVKINSYFPQSVISLEVITDSESDGESQLVAFIATDLSPERALQTLNKFDDEWWLDKMDLVDGRLSINVEFL